MIEPGCIAPAPGSAPCPPNYDLIVQGSAARFPAGWAWDAAHTPGTNMHGLVRAWAYSVEQLSKRACELLVEFRCHTVDETLDDWYRDYGLPDDCGINDLCAKVAAIGGQNCMSFIELGAMLGYDICCEQLKPETQVGCWNLGCDELAPEPHYRYGGSELGFAGLGDCVTEKVGVDLGLGPLGPDDCNIVGYRELAPDAVLPADNPCDADATCGEYHPDNTMTLLCGWSRRHSIEHYVGTGHHWIVGLTSDNPLIGSFGSCEPPPSIDQFDLGNDGLGTYVPGDDVPADYAISGCWDIGISELCQPAVEPVMCFIQRFKPAHTRAIRRYCENGSIIQ